MKGEVYRRRHLFAEIKGKILIVLSIRSVCTASMFTQLKLRTFNLVLEQGKKAFYCFILNISFIIQYSSYYLSNPSKH